MDPDISPEVRPSVLVRTDATGNKLLLKHNYGTVVYMYDSSSHLISETSEQYWLTAAGEITRCRLQRMSDYNQQVKLSTYPSYAIVLSEKKVDTYGRYALFVTESPTHSKVALLSAAGYRTGPGPVIIFGLGASDPVIHGQKYVQIMDLNSKTFIKEPLRIDGTEQSENYRFCWTEDEKYLVIYKPYENFSIVEINKTVQ